MTNEAMRIPVKDICSFFDPQKQILPGGLGLANRLTSARDHKMLDKGIFVTKVYNPNKSDRFCVTFFTFPRHVIGSDDPGIVFGRLAFSPQKYHQLEGDILGEPAAKPAGCGRLFVFRDKGEEAMASILTDEQDNDPCTIHFIHINFLFSKRRSHENI